MNFAEKEWDGKGFRLIRSGNLLCATSPFGAVTYAICVKDVTPFVHIPSRIAKHNEFRRCKK